MSTTPVSPKVKAGANWAAYATLALTLLSTITPDSLSFLGVYSPLAYGVIVGGTYALGAYLKADPLRVAPTDPAPAGKPAQDTSAALAQVSADAQRTPASTYPAAAVAAAEAPAEVTPIVPA